MKALKSLTKKDLITFAVTAVFGLIFLLIFAQWNTPLYPNCYGGDSSFFHLMGQAILKGKVMYRDYVDVKGPAFFYWEALGQLLCSGRGGVFILEIVCMLPSVLLILLLCKKYELNTLSTYIVFAAFFLSYSGIIYGGNTVEEFMMPLILLSIYMASTYIKDENYSLYFPAFFYGLTFSLCTFSKITVSVPLLSALFFLFICLLRKKEYKKLTLCGLLFLGGFLLIALPIIGYFYYAGALEEMFTWVFKYAYTRSVDAAYVTATSTYLNTTSTAREIWLIPCYGGILFSLMRIKNPRATDMLLLSESFFGCVALHLGTPFYYYFITQLPVILLLSINLAGDIQKEKHIDGLFNSWSNTLITIALCINIIHTLHYTAMDLESYKLIFFDHAMDYVQIRDEELKSYIPESELEDVCPLGASIEFYSINNILPTYKYINNTFYLTELDESIHQEIIDTLTNDPPKWIISEDITYIFPPSDPIVQLIAQKYDAYVDCDVNKLYKLKE